MNKKIFIFTILILLAGCGFTPMLKNYDLSKLNVQKVNYSGKNDLSYLIKIYLNIQETKSSQGMTVNISVSESISSATKNSAGITTEEDLTINIGLNVLDGKDKIITSDNFTSSRRLTVTNNLSSDEETRRIEKSNLIQNLAQKIKFKLQLIAKQNQ